MIESFYLYFDQNGYTCVFVKTYLKLYNRNECVLFYVNYASIKLILKNKNQLAFQVNRGQQGTHASWLQKVRPF